MLKKVIGVYICLIMLISSSCMAAATRVPFSNNFDLNSFVQRFNARTMENVELKIIGVNQVRLNTGETRYKCLLSDNYACINFDMRGSSLVGLSVVAMGREGKFQAAIESLYSAAELMGVPGTRDDFWNVASAQYRGKTSRAKAFAMKKSGNGYDVWAVEAYPTQNRDVFVGLAIWHNS